MSIVWKSSRTVTPHCQVTARGNWSSWKCSCPRKLQSSQAPPHPWMQWPFSKTISLCSWSAQMGGSDPRPSLNAWQSVRGSRLSEWSNWKIFVSWNPLNDSSINIWKFETQHWRSIFQKKLHFLGRNTSTPSSNSGWICGDLCRIPCKLSPLFGELHWFLKSLQKYYHCLEDR